MMRSHKPGMNKEKLQVISYDAKLRTYVRGGTCKVLSDILILSKVPAAQMIMARKPAAIRRPTTVLIAI